MTATDRIAAFIRPETQVASAPLVVFRIIFGALMLFGTSRFLYKGWVQDLYITPDFHFGYLGFEWVTPLPGNWMYLPFVLMIIASLGILLGAFYRGSAILFFLAFTYVELLDKTNYLNHYYFVSLVSFLMIFVPANADCSIDARRNSSIYQKTIPQWSIRILQFQLACVYFFAGVAKVQSDWLLDAQPLKTWLQAHRDLPYIGPWLAQESVAYLFSWFGCIYDLFIVLFLLLPKTRPWAYACVIFFHLTTWYLFPIGVFPWVMIFSTLLFFPPDFHRNLLKRIKQMIHWRTPVNFRSPATCRVRRVLLIAFITLQILIPIRFLLYPEHLFWHEEGFRFSWRVMLMHKEGYATFWVKDRTTGERMEIITHDYLTENQIDQMSTQPDMILQFAHYLAKTYQDTTLHFGNQSVHLHNPSVHARIFVSLNGRPSQLFVHERHDLTHFEYDLKHRDWLEPYHP